MAILNETSTTFFDSGKRGIRRKISSPRLDPSASPRPSTHQGATETNHISTELNATTANDKSKLNTKILYTSNTAHLQLLSFSGLLFGVAFSQFSSLLSYIFSTDIFSKEASHLFADWIPHQTGPLSFCRKLRRHHHKHEVPSRCSSRSPAVLHPIRCFPSLVSFCKFCPAFERGASISEEVSFLVAIRHIDCPW